MGLKTKLKSKLTADKKNNATVVAKSNVAKQPQSLKVKSIKSNGNKRYKKVTPIIQTRGMKAKAKQANLIKNKKVIVTQADLHKLNDIDKLSYREFADGDENGIYHNGVELSIQGSDIEDDFPEVNPTQPPSTPVGGQQSAASDTDDGEAEVEPGEIYSSGGESSDEDSEIENNQHRNGNAKCMKTVVSKVVKVTPRGKRDKRDSTKVVESGNKFEKFNHLRNDPDFREFLGEMMDERLAAAKKPEKKKKSDYDNDKINSPSPPLVRGFKSPSDMTIYSPGLRKVNSEDVSLIEKISNFVASIRLDGSKKEQNSIVGNRSSGSGTRNMDDQTPTTSRQKSPKRVSTGDMRRIEKRTTSDANNRLRSPGGVADNLLVQAEKFKARIEAPKGNGNLNMGFGEDF